MRKEYPAAKSIYVKSMAATAKKLFKEIEEAADRGEWSIKVEEPIDDFTEKLIIDQGFEIEKKRGKGTFITWKNAQKNRAI